jgi:exodeoxyribonuclease V
MEFTAQQLDAIAAIKDWYAAWQAGSDKQVFFLTGRAGTGKTSIARAAAEECVSIPQQIEYIAPTGKAAARLRQKGCANAKTLHSFAYNYRGEDSKGDPIFHEKEYLNVAPLIVVMDEASMVGSYDMDAVLRHGLPVLAIGDLNQLPPVKAPYSLTEDHVDFELTEILRQKADSKIIQAADLARRGVELPFREYEDVRIRQGKPDMDELIAHVQDDAQILCSKNDTRHGMNNRIRAALGFTGNLPQVGERILCMFNQHRYGFMNGEFGVVEKYEDIPEHDRDMNESDGMKFVTLKSLTDGSTKRLKFNTLCFSDDEEAKAQALKAIGGFAFGYVCTIHKSQGSEWPKILVIDEPMRPVEKLRYTAYTRAQDRLTVYRR